ncbi:hypothetical protein JB92DRAFT_3001650 [Gautieria morchelliformis]|nr:hypothetical protein JB92DRAFT_3001650 [Gautieria morchelliformis]
MQASGNRARFFAPQAAKAPDASGVSASSRDGNSTSSACSKEPYSISSEFDSGSNKVSTTATGSFAKNKLSNDELVPHRSTSDSSESEASAQRTRMPETEMVYNANREGHGRLNLSGLIKHVDTNFAKAVPQSANIKEVVENEELGIRSPRQYPGSKLISKSNTPPHPSAYSHFISPPPVTSKGSFDMPPSNQLAQPFKMPSHPAPRSDISAEDDSRTKEMSNTSHADTSNSHISGRLPANSSDDSIKSLTTAFNRKRSGPPRNTIARFPSPVSHHSNSSRSGRPRSPHGPVEDELLTDNSGAFGQRGPRIESRNFSSGISSDGEFQENIFPVSEHYHGSAEVQYGHHGPHGKRGEKRISDANVDDDRVPLGKRARIDAYDEVRGQFNNL